MRKLIPIAALAIITIATYSCGSKTDEQQLQIDSLRNALESRDSDYSQLKEFVNIVAEGLDSINAKESDIYNTARESPVPNKTLLKKDLENLKQILASHRQRIEELETSIDTKNAELRNLKTIISSMKAQIDDKESKIKELQAELDGNGFTIAMLNKRIGAMAKRDSMQKEKIRKQNATIEEQDIALNEAFIKIASKRELKEAGLLSGKFLAKNKLDVSKLDRSIFRTIDRRKVTSITINSKKVKILSQVPEESYALERKDNTTILKITNPQHFWSVTKYLVIQAD